MKPFLTTPAKINGIKTKICKHKKTEGKRAGSIALLQFKGLCLHQLFSTANSIKIILVLYPKLWEQHNIFPLQSRRKKSGKPEQHPSQFTRGSYTSLNQAFLQYLFCPAFNFFQRLSSDRAEAKHVLMILIC